MSEGESIIVRHGDKGKWKIDEQELRASLAPEEAELVLSVLKSEFEELTETPLKLEGIKRSLRLGDALFEKLPERSVLVSIDSGKDRAQLTRALATARIAQREAQYNKEHGKDAKRVDMLQVDEKELVKLMADSSDKTWTPFAEMMTRDGISEAEAVARWLNEMNRMVPRTDPAIHPEESAQRYRQAVRTLRERITSDKVPVVLFGAGHSGALGQIRYEKLGVRPATAEDAPKFCEMFMFDAEGNLVKTEGVEV
ncbi:hypothetical protein A3B21_03225 [Candidatus Uhrbacteria bacterium RIFCSPLOWO2_01_FULL_47_24]|uniref:Uncharacterized protein n=1 Tax=Candidatus Uhrbacteria bacterium RIFCSPLOWO2_01_FULL_47_24 TaxID=1802401 RepID=A0A1F7URN4_9BACT|nr:MAG: hypothetical protein A2753_05160 [Candidatus Uhrbacteria bacterium RIFCSPHIGHO2_01_FULL_47_11]OGL67598.1 MAG: hypothetical protein A3D58_03825 [Candidatus Uhrbacteria bacterium RIFCSPHIGHO2_02_FULL_46_47]OGL75789.1 MAG: hypothetical protein A3F52_05640 [Candidatus Uhrbacteria bacterium RIFCSPHIGHO2_12_FULL_47_11]OGL80952.1 MAG: hypothetical protein A3B21_03225 [Candidatus Uhrbacteria bacterium RIFCSPLOWO2_01_FULL_47_24]OGL84287.1 MAG: hypothetical protein A3J03_03225 [Candidatus Uhrbact